MSVVIFSSVKTQHHVSLTTQKKEFFPLGLKASSLSREQRCTWMALALGCVLGYTPTWGILHPLSPQEDIIFFLPE